MQKRQKHLRIIEHYTVSRYRQFERFLARHGMSVLTDAAVGEYAQFLVNEARYYNRVNAENRRIAAQRDQRSSLG